MRLLLLLLLAGCGESDPCSGKSGVCIAVHVSGSVPRLDALSVNVKKSDASVLHGETGFVMPKIDLPVQFALRLPQDTTGQIDVAVLGVVGSGIVASGTGSVDVPASGHARVDVVLGPLMGGDLAAADLSASDANLSADLATVDLTVGGDLAGFTGLSPDPVDFGELDPSANANAILTFTNGKVPLIITSIMLTGDPAFARTSGTCQVQGTVNGGDSCTIVITYSAGATPRAATGQVIVTAGPDSYTANLIAHTTGWVVETIPSVSPLPDFSSVSGSSPADVWVGGSSGAIYHRSNGMWSAPTGILPWSPTAKVHLYSPAAGVVYVAAGGLYYSGDGGATWGQPTEVFTPTTGLANYVYGSDANTVYAGSTMGNVEVGNNATGFQADGTTGTTSVVDIFFGGSRAFALSGSHVYIRQSASMWSSVLDESTTDTLFGGAAVSTDEFYVGGKIKDSSTCLSHCAVVFHKSLAGTMERDLAGAQVNEVWVNSSSDIWGAADNGKLYHSLGDDNWNQEAVPTINNLEDVWGKGGELFVVGANATIIHKY